MSTVLLSDNSNPRLCHLIKWKDYDRYGFCIDGQVITFVTPGSPAHYGGVKEGDCIIEVNGENVESKGHGQLLQFLRSIPHEMKLLVVDEKTNSWYRERNLVVKSTLPNVIRLKTPTEDPNKLSVKPVDIPNSRLCHLIKRKDYKGYGFSTYGQIILSVHSGSPAVSCGLREGNCIIEVNGVNVKNKSHEQMCEMICSIPHEVKLLVVDK